MPTIILLDVSLSMCRSVKNFSTKESANSSGDSVEIKQLANVGIGTLLDYLAQNCQLEYTSLIVFSSLWEIRHQFTRHHETIKNGIYDLELYDKSNIVNAVRGVLSLKLNEWVQNGPINIVLITDGQLYHESMNTFAPESDEEGNISGGKGSVESESTSKRDHDFNDIPLSDLEGQFDFPCKMQVICLSSPHEPALKYSLPFYKNLISLVDNTISDPPVVIGNNMKSYKQSAIWLPDTDTLDLSVELVENLFTQIAELHYKPYHATLSCGHLYSMVMISPSPTECLVEPLKNEFDDLKREQSLMDEAKETFVSAINKVRLYKLNDEINICGFMPFSEIASPSVTSRHLVLPIVNSKFNETSKAEQILLQDPNLHNKQSLQTGLIDESMTDIELERGKHSVKIQEPDKNKPPTRGTSNNNNEQPPLEQDITKQPSFCVMLHNGLKQENMVAICIVGKSEETNEDWYGMLHSHTDTKKRSSLILSLLTPGPTPILWLPNFKTMGSAMLNADLPPAIRDKITTGRVPPKSYSSNNVIWLDPESVQADVQKIVRHAKRSPDKAPHFYKELNRIRRAAISYGFYDVLFGLASILEREKRVMLMDQNKCVNKETLDHIDHVVECLRSSLNEDSYDTNIIPKV